MTGHRPYRALIALFAVLTLFGLLGCASREPAQPSGKPASAGFPVDVAAPGGQPVHLTSKPQRIVSLSPVVTETLFAVGAGQQVVAADEQSDYPPQAPRTKLSGFQPNIEALSQHKPDLVIASYPNEQLSKGLQAMGVPLFIAPAATDLETTYGQISAIGKATGHSAEADALVQRMRSDIDKIVRDTPKPERALTYYHELDPQLYSVTSRTFVGKVYELFGLRNVADKAPGGSDYPQLSAEYLIQANPDLIFVSNEQPKDKNRADLAARPGWQSMKAVQQGHVVTVKPDLSSRWGPRVVDFVRAVSDAVHAVEK